MKIFFLIIYNAYLHSPLCKKHFKEDGGGGGIYKHWKCVDWFKNVWLSFLQDSETFKTVYMENIAENKT